MTISVFLGILIFCLYYSESNGQTYLNATTTAQTFNSHPEYGTQNYNDNYTAEWYITSIYENTTVEVSVTSCDIEHLVSTKGSQIFCSWDWDLLAFYDVTTSGNDTVTSYLQSTCCNGSISSLQSSGSTMYIQFTTDSSNNRAGFQISYVAYGVVVTTDPVTTADSGSAEASSADQENTSNASVAIGVVFAILAVILIVVAIVIYFKCCKKNPGHTDESGNGYGKKPNQVHPETSSPSTKPEEPVLDPKNDVPSWARGKD